MLARMATARDADGQATVELVALLPLLAVVAALIWQAVVAGHALWLAGSAANAAARARAIGGDPAKAAQRVLPAARVRRAGDGVELRVPVPTVVRGAHLGTISVRARVEPQA
jgi:Flp pilus assembly protein TadG